MEGLISMIISKKMQNIGYKQYSVQMENIQISNAVPFIHILAQNEFWWLIDVNDTTDDFYIQGENNIVGLADINISGVPYTPIDFTGDIIIEKSNSTVTQTLLFARVIAH
jgi:hypothetical protein